MEIRNPRRILAVSLEEYSQQLSWVMKELTGSHPEPVSATLAGTTHILRLATAYYSADVPVWLDLTAAPDEWAASFLSPEAEEVLKVLGGVVVVFALPSSSSSSADDNARARNLIAQVGRVLRDRLGGWAWDGVGLVVGVGGAPSEDDDWEDICAEWELEFVHASSSSSSSETDARNEFGEKVGIARALEALQANDWSGGDGHGHEVPDGSDQEVEEFGEFTAAAGEALLPRREGLAEEDEGKAATREGEHDDEHGSDAAQEQGNGADGQDGDEPITEDHVQKLERMMLKLQAVRDRTAGMPEDQRKRVAREAVGEIMKDL